MRPRGRPGRRDRGPGERLAQLVRRPGPGRRTAASIDVPALIADGTADRIDALANDYALARLIPGARLVLYPDAGHAFLFQEGPPFTALIESFFSGARN